MAACSTRRRVSATPCTLRVAVLAPPHISNLDEFLPLARVPGLRLVWARHAAQLEGADWVVLPGSKQVSGDLAWLRARRHRRGHPAPRRARRCGAGCVRRLADAGPEPARPAGPRRPGRARPAGPRPAAACAPTSAPASGCSTAPVRLWCAARPLGRPGRRRALRAIEIRCGDTVARRPHAVCCATRVDKPSAGSRAACWVCMPTACSNRPACCRPSSAPPCLPCKMPSKPWPIWPEAHLEPGLLDRLLGQSAA
jgi:hypothetical protein